MSEVKAQCGSCKRIDVYALNHDTGCLHCGSKSLWRVFDESNTEKVYDDQGNTIEIKIRSDE